MSAHRPLVGKWGRRAILAAAFLSVASVIGSLLYGSKLTPLQPTQADSYGFGPLGHHGFAETMKRLGMHVVQSRGDRFEGPASPMMFAEPSTKARVEGKENTLQEAIRLRAEAGHPTIVVLPKWSLFSGATEPFLSLATGRAEDVLDAALPRDFQGDRTWRVSDAKETTEARHELYGVLGTFVVEVPSLQVITQVPSLATVLLESAHGAVVLAAPDGTIVVSEPDLMHNFNLHRADHAAFWWTLLRDYDSDTLVLDEVFHGHGKQHRLGAALGEFPAVLLVVHVLLLLLLLVLLGMRRFGPALPPFAHGHGPAEAIGVAAHVLADGRKLEALAQEYVAQVLLDVHERLGITAGGTIEERARAIDSVAAQRGVTVGAQEILSAAGRLAPGRKGRSEAWRVARAAHEVRTTLLGERTHAGGVDGVMAGPKARPNEQQKQQKQQKKERAA